jgi:hypothetical protein
MPEDAKEAMGHGIRAKRSKSGAVSFDQSVYQPCINSQRAARRCPPVLTGSTK